jgi:hypothetical protein
LEPAQRHVGTIPGYFARTIESQPAGVSCVDKMLMCGKVTHKNLIDSLHYSEKLTKKKQN